MMPSNPWSLYKATPIEELRKPHPEQKRIDTESAALLRATALETSRRLGPSTTALPAATTASRLAS